MNLSPAIFASYLVSIWLFDLSEKYASISLKDGSKKRFHGFDVTDHLMPAAVPLDITFSVHDILKAKDHETAKPKVEELLNRLGAMLEEGHVPEIVPSTVAAREAD